MASKHFSDGSPISISALDALGAATVGTFTLNASGFTVAPPSGTARYAVVGNLVSVSIPSFSGTSNATTLVLSSLDAAILPSAARTSSCVVVTDNGKIVPGSLVFETGGTISVYAGPPGTVFENKGPKTVGPCEVHYLK